MMSKLTGWYVAFGFLGIGAAMRAQRPGEMTVKRDQIYRQCLEGVHSVEKMRAIARAFEKARCYPQAATIMKRVALEELPQDVKDLRKATYLRAKESKNKLAVLRVAQAFENEGATASAERLRRHAAKLPDPLEEKPIVTPAPAPTPEVTTPGASDDSPDSVITETDTVPESPNSKKRAEKESVADPKVIDTSGSVVETEVSDVRHSLNGHFRHASVAQS